MYLQVEGRIGAIGKFLLVIFVSRWVARFIEVLWFKLIELKKKKKKTDYFLKMQPILY